MSNQDLYMGWDLSTQQLKGIVVQSNLKLVHEAKADFDEDFSKYGIEKGVLSNPAEGEIFAPNAMWLEAIDLVMDRLKQQGLNFSRVKGISGAGMQHGTVFWSHEAEKLLENLSGKQTLIEQLVGERGAFSHPHSPNWQDASTQAQCDEFDAKLGDMNQLADITGSKAHHRFSGPQILRFRQKYPQAYENTSRISLVSSFLSSIFLGNVAPFDIGDVCGMNLWHIKKGVWQEDLLRLTAGSDDGVPELKKKLGPVPEDGGGELGKISKYFVERYNFSPDCAICPFTGDNPATILSLPLRASDAIVSLGTSTTFLMSTPEYKPDPAYHFMNHPTTSGLYMFMLCYKNGSLARERVRDDLNKYAASSSVTNGETPKTKDPWHLFNTTALSSPPLNQASPTDPMKLGLFFPRPEIVPNVPSGQWTYLYHQAEKSLESIATTQRPPSLPSSSYNPKTSGTGSINGTSQHLWSHPHDTTRAIVESQFLSLRLRSSSLVHPQISITGHPLPPQPRRIYLVGGGSVNPAIVQLAGEVLGGAEGVYRLDIGGNACALGSAYKAVWSIERQWKTDKTRDNRTRNKKDELGDVETFEDLIASRWNEQGFVRKVDQGYRKGIWEKYGEAVDGFEMVEKEVVREVAVKHFGGDIRRRRRSSLTMGSALSRERTGEMGG